ncbi:MAG TPA: FRG domain-containing protein [Candidatus Sulfotelmatobacter sp.]|nr:FRG domain-containing protein [Candidatus Sulfotelmatobacter sp.]
MKHAQFTFEAGPDIQSIEQFLNEIKRFAGRGDYRLYFRGHGVPTGALVPSIGRKHYYLGRSICFDEQAERQLLGQFRRHAYEHFGRIASEWETLFLARHYGLPTRLLDWTSNPLVALYFAAFYENEALVCSTDAPEPGTVKLNLDGTVWAIQRAREIAELDVFTAQRSPLDIPGIKLVYPFNPTPRMTAQSGFFTLHGDPWTDMVTDAGRPYPAADLDVIKLIKWQVKSQHKTGIVLELERLAINSRTLFPDLEGLARGLWQTEVIRKCFET